MNAEPLEVRYSKRTFSSPEPWSSRRWTRAGNLFHGVLSEKLNFFASALSVPPVQVPAASPSGASAPCSSVRLGSGTTRAASTLSVVPSPSHDGQAPYGELNEKLRGWGSSTLVPHLGHAAPWLNRRSGRPPSGATATSPLPSLSAASSESASRVALRGSTVRR